MPLKPLPFPETSRYECVRLLGEGGMGAVYLAEDRLTGARVALKAMLRPTAERLLRFKQEFRTVAELHHPNLVQLLELQKGASQWFFTMEYVDGQNLLQLLLDETPEGDSTRASGHPTLDVEDVGEASFVWKEGEDAEFLPPTPCDLGALSSSISQLLTALEFLHGQGIVHRDLKPSNVLVDLHGRVKLLDFGIASRLGDSREEERGFVGTLMYMAPELFAGGEATPATDLYAVGCMLFQLLTGSLPFMGNTAQIARLKKAGEVPRVDRYVAGVPPRFVEVCAALMAQRPEDRPTLAQVREALGLGQMSLLAPSLLGQALPFVGRQEEFGRLREGLDRALAGEVQFALVSGQSGIGKSALASYFVSYAQRRGVLCLGGRCYERELLPFVAWDRLMDQMTLALQRWPRRLLAPMRESLDAVELIFPALGVFLEESAALTSGEESAALTSPERLARALEQFCELLMCCQVQVPLLLVLDDLQWTDVESIALLEKVLESCEGRIFILGLSRVEGVDEKHPLQRAFKWVEAHEDAQHLVLEAMEREACLALLAKVQKRSMTEAEVDAVLRQTGGSPLLMIQVIDYLAGLDEEERDAYLRKRKDGGEVLKGLLRRLRPEAEECLAALATAGTALPKRTLGGLLEVAPESFEKLLVELRSARMIKLMQRGVGGGALRKEIDVYHDQIREVLYQELPTQRRISLHRRCAQALEQEPARTGHYAEALKRHWSAVGDVEKCRDYTEKAAEFAVSKSAFHKAAVLLEELFSLPGGSEGPREKAERWEQIGLYYEWVSSNDDAIRAFGHALALWRAMPEGEGRERDERRCAELRLLGGLTSNQIARGQFRDGLEALEEGLVLLEVDTRRKPLSLAGVMLKLLGELALTRRPVDVPAVTEWEQTQLRFYNLVLPYLLLWPRKAPEPHLRFAIFSRRLGDRESEFRSALSKVIVKIFWGRGIARHHVPALREALELAEDIAKERGLVGGKEIAEGYLAFLHLPTELARVQLEGERALRVLARRGLGDGLDGNIFRTFLMHGMYLRGQFDALLRYGEQERNRARAHIPNRFWAAGYVVMAAVRTGRSDKAEDLLCELESFAGQLFTTFTPLVWAARSACALSRGAYHECLAYQETSGVGRLYRYTYSKANVMWMEVLLEAACCLIRLGEIRPAQLRKAWLQAQLLKRHHAQPFRCLGYRALAWIAHARGRESAAKEAMREALAISAEVEGRYSRWLCLESADAMGMSDEVMRAEAEALKAQGGYVSFMP